MAAGRPLKFKTVEELQEKIEDYFNTVAEDEISWTGLALHLDTSRETLGDYKKKPEFSDSLKKALLRVENAYELRLIKKSRSGDIFALKNFGWKDKQEIEQTTLNVEADEDITKEKADEIKQALFNSTSQLPEKE